ncbi:MAG: ion channel [Candidatus Marinimicrobia bacterium]|nr:ion channel [Candidatus Neomarinimicrobiota bacterium]
MKKFKEIIQRTTKNNYFLILFGIIISATIGAIVVTILEPKTFTSIFGAIWWAIVTMTTVGYGDIVPHNFATRVVSIFIIFTGISLVSLFTATISSMFVARKIREGKGLEKINQINHLVICGWNSNTEKLIESILDIGRNENFSKISLINNLPEDEINNIIYKFKDSEIKFIRGDYTKEIVLKRSNIEEARAVIILPNDTTQLSDSDEKTLFATLTIKSISSKIPVIVFLENNENRIHLKRANADEIFVKNEYSGFILASSVLMPGVPQTISELMDTSFGASLVRNNIPHKFVDKTFKELSEYFRISEGSILIGVFKESEQIAFTELLSSDTSQLDAYIEKKLKMAGHSLGEKNRMDINLNPNDDYVIKEKDVAILINKYE